MTTSDHEEFSKAWHLPLLQDGSTLPLCQTADEQAALTTGHLNGVGFNKFDAPILAARSMRYGSLTLPQALLVLRKLAKYASQLASMGLFNQIRASESAFRPEKAP